MPLLDETARRHDKATLKVAAGDQLLHQQPGHDRLAGARIVGEEEAERLPRQHFAVDRRNLMRQRIDQTGVDRQIGVEKVGQLDTIGLCHQPQQGAVGIERPRPSALFDFEAMLVVPVENRFGDNTVVIAVDDADRLIADPVHGQDLCRLCRGDAPHRRAVPDLLESRHHPPSRLALE